MFNIWLEYWEEAWTEGKAPYIEAHFSGSIPVSPGLACRQVGDFLKTQGLSPAFPGTPILFWGQRPVWRVPACFPIPGLEDEDVIRLGVVDVDALTGELMQPAPEQWAKIRRRAWILTAWFTGDGHVAVGGATARPVR